MTPQQIDRQQRIFELERDNCRAKAKAEETRLRMEAEGRRLRDLGHSASAYVAIVTAPVFLL